MAAYTIAEHARTLLITTAGDTVTTRRGFMVKVSNVDPTNVVSFSEQSSPTGAITAGQQSSLLPAPATGRKDTTFLFPDTKYFFKAAVANCLCTFEELAMP